MSQITLRERPMVLTNMYGVILGALPILDSLGFCAHHFTPERAKQLSKAQQQAKLTGYSEIFIEELTDEELIVLYEAIIISKFQAQGKQSKSWVDR